MVGGWSSESSKLYGEPGPRMAGDFVEEMHSDEFQYPADQMAKMLRLFNTRRIEPRDNDAGARLSFGGALGAIGGLLAGYLSSPWGTDRPDGPC